MKQLDVVALGELLIDFAPQGANEAGYPVLSANPGGAPGNFLAALTKYGCKTTMIGKVGDDAFGRLLVKTLELFVICPPALDAYRRRFRYIHVDEYQDTNRVQDKLFSCLSRDENNMFLVGDIKQSIYRFRLASPEIFVEKLESYPEYDPSAPQKRSKISLSKNFRSRKGITQGVNFLFSSVMSKECGEISYNGDEKLVCGAERSFFR